MSLPMHAFCSAAIAHTYRMHDDVALFSFPAFEKTGLVNHGFTTRLGGISTGSRASLNLSFNRADSREEVMENYRRMCTAANIREESLVMNAFEHGTKIQPVDRNDCGRGYTREPLPLCDGLITDDPAVTLVTGHADCMAVYVLDPQRKCIGLAHAGWKGALGCIGANMVQALRENFCCDPAQLLVGIGPCICKNCFEVDLPLAQRFAEAFGSDCCREKENGKALVDLPMTMAVQLVRAGVRAERISYMNVCTFEDERLFSHRRDRGDTGAMSAFLGLRS